MVNKSGVVIIYISNVVQVILCKFLCNTVAIPSRFLCNLWLLYPSRPQRQIPSQFQTGPLDIVRQYLWLSHKPTLSPNLGSIQGPYRNGSKDTSFPIYRTVESPGNVTDEIYARSLLGTGNGMPLSDPRGNLSRPQSHLKNGAFLGDVGYIGHNGRFQFAFNIFSAADHPFHKNGTPPTFSPALLGISKDDSIVIPSYHPPGTVIVSPGITVTQATNPL